MISILLFIFRKQVSVYEILAAVQLDAIIQVLLIAVLVAK